MTELIHKDSAKLVVEYIKKHVVPGDSDFLQGYLAGIEGLADGLMNLPAVDAVKVVHGRWIVDVEHLRATCSECGKTLRFSDEMQIAFLPDEERFCYSCGAKMDLGDEHGL